MQPARDDPPLLLPLLALLRGGALASDSPERAIAELAARLPQHGPPEDWHAAMTAAVRAGYVYDPVRIDSGSLHCRWRLELTPAGSAVVG